MRHAPLFMRIRTMPETRNRWPGNLSTLARSTSDLARARPSFSLKQSMADGRTVATCCWNCEAMVSMLCTIAQNWRLFRYGVGQNFLEHSEKAKPPDRRLVKTGATNQVCPT